MSSARRSSAITSFFKFGHFLSVVHSSRECLLPAVWWNAEERVKVFPLLTQNAILSDMLWSRLGTAEDWWISNSFFTTPAPLCIGGAVHWTHDIMPNEMSLYIVHHPNDRNAREITLYSNIHRAPFCKKGNFHNPYRLTAQLAFLK